MGMDSPQAKDIIATSGGGIIGVDLFWTGLDGIIKGQQATPPEPFDVMDYKLLLYGLGAAVLGFMAWRDERKKVHSETTTIRKETIVNDQPSQH